MFTTATLLATQLEGGSNERRGGEDRIGLMGDEMKTNRKSKLADTKCVDLSVALLHTKINMIEISS